jgi:hypothetical protein
MFGAFYSSFQIKQRRPVLVLVLVWEPVLLNVERVLVARLRLPLRLVVVAAAVAAANTPKD